MSLFPWRTSPCVPIPALPSLGPSPPRFPRSLPSPRVMSAATSSSPTCPRVATPSPPRPPGSALAPFASSRSPPWPSWWLACGARGRWRASSSTPRGSLSRVRRSLPREVPLPCKPRRAKGAASPSRSRRAPGSSPRDTVTPWVESRAPCPWPRARRCAASPWRWARPVDSRAESSPRTAHPCVRPRLSRAPRSPRGSWVEPRLEARAPTAWRSPQATTTSASRLLASPPHT